ncbi:TonB-dependent receptor [Pseudothauera nasutitermitis]|uniref:TonB-dependent receptor n=1 Tax=Pseudothauera nasutitermitis TaxID=2565930 RepID=UPI001454D146|nr:TonB-dependent receptor [Pseudothauera nasutitermitis]
MAAFLPDTPVHAQALPAGAGDIQQHGARAYDIPSGPLAQVLTRFAQEAGALLSFDAGQLQGLRSAGVQGVHSVDEGFRQILAGSGLEAIATAAGRYVLRPALPDISAEGGRDAVELKNVLVTGRRTRDEAGHDAVYEKDISNAYVDRQYMERYRGVSVGDVFAGVNGVYNSDNRNGAALYPNIRGLSGNGRIPVTVDGTVQSIDVWMGRQGINNRNYVDPNLFRSIEVEKGPSMTRGLKSGIGGAVNIRTIDADDIVENGRNWGLELKLGTASNSIKDSTDAHALAGKDYRNIPGAITAAPIGTPGLAFLEPQIESRKRSDTRLFNLDDRKLFLAGAYKHEVFDVLAAYTNSRRGNYFAGKKGASDYLQNERTNPAILGSTKGMYPNIARLFTPGWEVPYTSTDLESLLLKANWNLPDGQKLSFSYTRNDLAFSELPSSITADYVYRLDSDAHLDLGKRNSRYPFPATTVDQDIYRLGYQWKPADSRWIDLDVGLWQTDSKSRRYQNGDYTYQMKDWDLAWDNWVRCNYAGATLCTNPALIGTPEPAKGPNTDDRYTVFIGNEIQTRSTRSGVDLSNRFRFSDHLALTATADWQHERQKDHTPVETSVMGMGVSPSKFGPASGRRQEYGAGALVEWRATDRLQLSAGTRYGAYWAYDDELDKRRAERDELWKSTVVNTHQQLQYRRLVSDDEMAIIAGNNALADAASAALMNWLMATGGLVQAGPEWDAFQIAGAASVAAQQAFNDYKTANNITDNNPMVDSSTGLHWWNTYAAVPLQDGKPDSGQNPFHNGTLDIDETVDNPQGVAGTYQKYQPNSHVFGGDFIGRASADPWKRPETQRAHAWSHMLAASYLLGERARVYARYASMPRFPSILEIANRISVVGGEFLYDSPKPERNDAWEVGYTYDLSGLLPALRRADVKLSYFHNTIRDFYDRTTDMAMVQFDRKVMSGVELQSRFDTGRFYGGLGATWRERQEMCDKDYAVFLDPYYSRLPECMEGGFPGTLSFASMQPRYSINLDLGARLLERRLDLGVRLRYHSSTENKKLGRLLRRYNGEGATYPLNITTGTIRPYDWQPVKLIDLYAEYRFDRHTTLRLSVENLTDRYYLDPLNRVAVPGPGRTVMLDLGFRF